MPTYTTASLAALLRDSGLLRPNELRELDDLLGRYSRPSALLRAVLKRGWLTPYQARELLSGRGQDLLLGDYVVLDRLGGGATALVYRAQQRDSEQVVALKVLRQGLPGPNEAVDRLCRESTIGTRLEHPNIVQTLGTFRTRAGHVLVMEYVDGTDLARLVREHGPLPVGRACDYVRQAALGLQYLDLHGLVHRDVKPSNLLLASGSNQVRILDHGIACQAGGVGEVAGTPDYVAPEQAVAAGRADTRADVYSLGCTLYHLLTGRVPFPGGTPEDKLRRHREEEPPAVEELRPEVPCELGDVVRKMMAKSPEGRFPTPGAAATALAPFAEPGGCEARFVLEVDDGGLAGLDPSQDTAVLGRPGKAP